MMFVGDSLQRNQWQSFVCLVDSVIPENQKSMKRGRVHSVFRVKVCPVTIFFWDCSYTKLNDLFRHEILRNTMLQLSSIGRRSWWSLTPISR